MTKQVINNSAFAELESGFGSFVVGGQHSPVVQNAQSVRIDHGNIKGHIFNNSAFNGEGAYFNVDSSYSSKKAQTIIAEEKNGGNTAFQFHNSASGNEELYHAGTVMENNDQIKGLAKFSNSIPKTKFQNDLDQTITTLTRKIAGVQAQKLFIQQIEDFVPIVRDGVTFANKLFGYQTRNIEVGQEEDNFITADNTSNTHGQTTMNIQTVETQIIHYVHEAKYNLIQAGTNSEMLQINYLTTLIAGVTQHYQKNLEKLILGEGLKRYTQIKGLTNAAVATENSSVITQTLSSLTDADFINVVSKIVDAYYTSTNNTYDPNTFAIPLSEKRKLAGQTLSNLYPYQSRLKYLEDTLTLASNEPVKVVGNDYFDKTKNSAGKFIYMIYRKDPEVMCMHMTNPFNVSGVNTANGYSFAFTTLASQSGLWVKVPSAVVRFSHS
jgi:hypothetical protein